jgi:DNA-binding LacI/PurR family transcriptional regulator
MVTIKDIARRLSISSSSVSRALNGKRGVSAELCERVKKVAKEIGYHPDSTARALIGGKVRVIGVIIPRSVEYSFSNAYYPLILQGICERCRALNYHVLLSFAQIESYTELFFRRLADGIIVCANRIDDKQLDDLGKNEIPTCLIPGYPKGKRNQLPSVDADHFQSTYTAVSHLIDLGHSKIAFILGAGNSKYTIDRLNAYQKALKDNGIEFKLEYAPQSDFTREQGYNSMKRLLKLNRADRPTAVLCTNDVITLGAIQAINEKKMKFPEDISIVSIGDTAYTKSVVPSLTTIYIPYHLIGIRAAELVIKQINRVKIRRKCIELPSRFIVRNSTAKPNESC